MFLSNDISLFSPQAIGDKQHRSLLIQFILFEIFEAQKAISAGRLETLFTPHPRFFPYDWNRSCGYFNKIQEHSLLLGKSFPDGVGLVKNFEKTLSEELSLFCKETNAEQFTAALQKIYTALEPLAEICKENENLILFLLKNRESMDSLNQSGYLYQFLLKMHPSGLEILGEKMCDQYHQRGFFSQISEFKLLLTELSHA
jgi:hypothetical protein